MPLYRTLKTEHRTPSECGDLSPVHDWNTTTINGAVQTRTHGPAHELLTMSGAQVTNSPRTLTYDTKGNMTTDDRGCGMTWDFDNMLQSFAANGVTDLKNATYEYDAIGRRVAKNVAETGGTQTTVFVQADQKNVTQFQLSALGNPTIVLEAVYAVNGNVPLIHVHKTASSTSSFFWFSVDRHNSVYSLTSQTSTTVELYYYDSYGNQFATDSSGAALAENARIVNHCLTAAGKYLDREANLARFSGLQFRPSLGMYASRNSWAHITYRGSYYFATSVYRTDNAKWTIGKPVQNPAGAHAGKKCAVTMRDYGGEIDDLWIEEAEKAGDVVLIGVSTPQQIVDFINKNKCCTLYTIGHRGGPSNEGGTVTYPDPVESHKPVQILPNPEIEAAIKNQKCTRCAINVVACGDARDPSGPERRRKMAEATGCIVCGSVDVHAIGVDQTLGDPFLGQDPFGNSATVPHWKHSCELPPGGGWEEECIRWEWVWTVRGRLPPHSGGWPIPNGWERRCVEYQFVPTEQLNK